MTETPPAPATAPAPAGAPSPPTLEQVLRDHPHLAAELDSRTANVAAREKDQGRRSGLQEWAKGLGVDDPDVVADGYRKYAEQQKATMSEADRARAEAEQDRAAAQRELAAAKQARFDAAAIKHLSAANAEDPAVLAPSLLALGVTVDSTDEEIQAAVGKLRERTPGAFTAKPAGTPGGGNPGGPPAGSPGGTGSGQNASAESESKAQLERVQNRYKRGGGSR